MGAYDICKICGNQTKLPEVDNNYICEDCQDKALRIGIKILMEQLE